MFNEKTKEDSYQAINIFIGYRAIKAQGITSCISAGR